MATGEIPMLAEKGDPALGRKLERMRTLAKLATTPARANSDSRPFGTPTDAHTVEQLGAVGVTRCIFGIKSAPEDKVLAPDSTASSHCATNCAGHEDEVGLDSRGGCNQPNGHAIGRGNLQL